MLRISYKPYTIESDPFLPRDFPFCQAALLHEITELFGCTALAMTGEQLLEARDIDLGNHEQPVLYDKRPWWINERTGSLSRIVSENQKFSNSRRNAFR